MKKGDLIDDERNDEPDDEKSVESGFPVRVGILFNNFLNGIVRPDVPNAFEDVFIDRANLFGAPFGMKVVCEIIEAPKDYEMRGRQYQYDELTGKGMAKGRIIEVLGDARSNDTAMMGILISHGLKEEFPADVAQKAKTFIAEISEDDIRTEIRKGRKDLREEQIITIDGLEAKDLDDAISLTKTSDGNILLGVHIADVTHYVKENDPIDKEAVLRGTSVYLADRVIPMLPHVLSNNLCSLHPGRPKFTLSAFIEFDRYGNRISYEISETIIQSKERFTYDEVYDMLGPELKSDERHESFRPMLQNMYDFSKILRKKRFERGAINFDFPETKVVLDYEKQVIDVHAAPVTFANEIIEEFMIACNEAVAEKFAVLKAPFIYRIHEQPDPEKFERFRKIAKLLGEKVKFSKELKSDEIHHFIQKIEDKPYGSTLMQMLLRSMAKARYSNRNLGHFGLSSDFYCHFTSPIRRYPDLFIHRVIKTSLQGIAFPRNWIKLSEKVSDTSSDTERNAMEAERESVNFKTAEYMERHVGETFSGKVTGMFNAGIFVQLENTIEGLAPFRTMNGYFEFFEDEMVVRCYSGNKTIRIGDPVSVEVINADRIARRIEFRLNLESLQEEKPRPQTRSEQQNKKFRKSGGNNGSKNKKKSTGRKNR
ncbi:MAG: ribonuclease R [Saccharofermentanales bacterium]